MRTSFAMAAVLTGFVLWAAPAMAADAQRRVVTAEKDVPTGPRICLFSQNGRLADPQPTDAAETEAPADAAATHDAAQQAPVTPPKVDVAQSEPATTETAPQDAQAHQAPSRVCDTDPAAPAPHG